MLASQMLLKQVQLEQARSRRERQHAARVRRSPRRLESRSVRRAVGRSMISIGARLAAEPQPRLARSR